MRLDFAAVPSDFFPAPFAWPLAVSAERTAPLV